MASATFNPQPPDKSSRSSERASGSAATASTQSTQDAGGPEKIDFLGIIGQAERISRDYHLRTVEKPLNRAYRAWQNLHSSDSKYLGPAWRGRSRVYIPKTRAAVRKNLATAAASLFSTEDVVNISAQFEDDPQQRATAAVIKADLDYRLTRSSPIAGIPWYLLSMGGCLDAQLTGVTVSKQYWEYLEVPTGKTEARQEPIIDPRTGMVAVDDAGLPLTKEVQVPVMRTVRDRPMIDIIPIENVGLDPAGPWYAPVQHGRWFTCKYPMGITDARAMLESGGKHGAGHAWLEGITDEVLMKGRSEDERGSSRRVREGGGDRYEESQAAGELEIVWIQENFLRIGGKDWHFWSVGRHAYLSEVREVHEVYPEFGGERPYVMGVAQLDTHRVFPQSPVETWQPLQLEINDIANLRLDTLKRSIAPLTVVKRGKNVDLAAVQRRGQPDAVVMVDSQDDIVFTPTPGPSGASYTETSVNNALFDELSGTFSTSSVQSSRQLNETVGGMRLMSGAANAVSEFDLRMWLETWVEPVLRQLVHLIRHYESDERILAIAGQNARVWTRFDYMPSIEDFEQTEVSLRVNAGIGALDPMQKLQKFKFAMEMLAPVMPMAQQKGITPNIEAIIEEVMGAAGFRDGRRFFEFGEAPQSQPDPELVKAMEELKLRKAELEQQFAEAMMQIQSERAMNSEDNKTKLQIESMRNKREVLKSVLSASEQRRNLDVNRKAAIEDREHSTRVRQEEGNTQRRQRIIEMLMGNAQKGQRVAA